MIAEYNRKSLIFGISGLILQFGSIFFRTGENQITSLGSLLLLAGTLLLMAGFEFYAKAKGRHPAWCLFAFLSLIGILALALLKDKSDTSSTET